jgi:hypothetical protein
MPNFERSEGAAAEDLPDIGVAEGPAVSRWARARAARIPEASLPGFPARSYAVP